MDAFVIKTKRLEHGFDGFDGSSKKKRAKVAPSSPAEYLTTGQLARRGQLKAANDRLLKDPNGTMRKSDAYEKTMHMQSLASGHQQGGGQGGAWMGVRMEKLGQQAAKKESKALEGLSIYINGLVIQEEMGKLDFVELIQRNGGRHMVHLNAKCSHIVTSTGLSAKKIEDLVTKQRGSKPYVVSPGWLFQTDVKGKRQPERNFQVLHHDTQRALVPGGSSPARATASSFVAMGKHQRVQHASERECPAQIPRARTALPKVVIELSDSEEEEDGGGMAPVEARLEEELDEEEMPRSAQRRR